MMNRLAALALTIIVGSVVAASAASYKADLDGAKGETVLFLLGMLDDYLGRNVIEDIPMVEHFYCGEHVHAFVFRAYLERLAREQHLSPQIEDQWRQDCLPAFYSPEISGFLNQFYPLSFDSSGSARAVTDLGPKRMANASLPREVVLGQRRRLQLAFLAGAYFRYGDGNKFVFANSSSKAQLIADVLKQVGCDSVRTTSRSGIPAQNATLFRPTAELSQGFKEWPSHWALERADTTVGLASLDELSIYEEVIRYAKQGSFDGCRLPVGFETGRFTSIPLARRRGDIPGVSVAEGEAIASYDSVCVSLRSVRDLAKRGVSIGAPAPHPFTNGYLSLQRIGFSRDGRTAAVVVSYNDGERPTCWRVVMAFAEKVSGTWQVARYATLQDR